MKKNFLVRALTVLAVSVFIVQAQSAFASESSISTSIPTQGFSQPFSSFSRLSFFGGASGTPGIEDSGASGAVLADFGRGMFSFGTGVEYLNLSNEIHATNSELTKTSAQVVALQYVGVPLYAKFNYVERPQASFSLKAGAMYAWLVNQQGDVVFESKGEDRVAVELNRDDIFGLVGFSGTAPLTDSLAFLVDGTYFYGLSSVDAAGSKNRGAMIGVGLAWSI